MSPPTDLETLPATTAANLAVDAPRGRWQRITRHPKTLYWIAPVLLLLFGGVLLGVWGGSVSELLRNGIVFCLLALGSSVVIATGQIDLSAIGVATISGVLFALVSGHYGPNPGALWIVFSVLLTLLFGAASGALVSGCYLRFRVPMLIFSWAIGAIYGIVAILLTPFALKYQLPEASDVSLPWLIPSNFWAFGGSGFYLAVISIFVTITVFGAMNLPQRAAAMGASETSAVLAGVSKKRTFVECFVMNGLLAAAAGILFAFFNSTASTIGLRGQELVPIAIAVLGGTSLSGGYLSIWSVVAAAFFWTTTVLIGPHLPGLIPGGDKISAELGQILFYGMFFLVSLAFGRLLAPAIPKIFARKDD